VNTNKAIDLLPNVIASKTGFTDLAGGNLVVAFDAGIAHPIIIAVLGSSFDGRFDDMTKLVNSTIEYLSGR
jgi:D-alanyl-D-alanine carboxypeptidase